MWKIYLEDKCIPFISFCFAGALYAARLQNTRECLQMANYQSELHSARQDFCVGPLASLSFPHPTALCTAGHNCRQVSKILTPPLHKEVTKLAGHLCMLPVSEEGANAAGKQGELELPLHISKPQVEQGNPSWAL